MRIFNAICFVFCLLRSYYAEEFLATTRTFVHIVPIPLFLSYVEGFP